MGSRGVISVKLRYLEKAFLATEIDQIERASQYIANRESKRFFSIFLKKCKIVINFSTSSLIESY